MPAIAVAAHVGDGVLVCRPCDSQRTVHPLCFPIPIPDNDPFYPTRDALGRPACLPVTRSTPGQLTLGKWGWGRNQPVD